MTAGTHFLRLAACAAGGAALAVSLGAVAVLRRDRPLHAYGQSHDAVLDVDTAATLGVPLLDEVSEHRAVVRISRAMSLALTGPDIIGLALRTDEGTTVDLLFASTGSGVLTRHLLQPRLEPRTATLTTLLPMTTASGLGVVLRLAPSGPDQWELTWAAVGRHGWTHAGSLRLVRPAQDPGHFDPTGRPPQGLRPPTWVKALRAPAYTVARLLRPQVASSPRRRLR